MSDGRHDSLPGEGPRGPHSTNPDASGVGPPGPPDSRRGLLDSGPPIHPASRSIPLPSIPGYEVLDELGRGGMGVVYKARQLSLNRLVAIKMVRGFAGWEDRLRFVHESEMVAELHHTNIVHLYEVGSVDDMPYFAMEYMDGGTLASRFKGKPQPPHEAAKLVEQLARAMHLAHERGIVHRDLKPANILFGADGCPKITDFGVAKRLTDQMALTQSGEVMGTPHYMAPEQARGAKQIGPAADVYSLGSILYELLAGRTPFVDGESQVHLLQRILTEEPISPAYSRPELPRGLEAICLKCLKKEPSHRYASSAAFADDLSRFLADEPIHARPTGKIGKAIKKVRRRPVRAMALLLSIVALSAIGHRIWRWDAYEREHIEYYNVLPIQKWGELQGTGPLTPEQVSHRHRSYRIHRHGRYGPAFACDVVNGRGVIVANEVTFGNLLQGVGFETSMPITACRTEYKLNDQGHIVEEVGLDRYSQVAFRLQYDYRKGTGDPRSLVIARYATPDGYELSSPFGASYVQFRRNAEGRDEQLMFVDSKGQPNTNADGVYGIKLVYSPNGRSTRMTSIDQSGQPMVNLLGGVHLDFDYDEAGRALRFAVIGVDDKPIAIRSGPMEKIATVRWTYDGYGNMTSRAYFDGSDKPAEMGGRAKENCLYNERGDRVETAYFDKAGKPVSPPGSAAKLRVERFDDRGNPIEVSLFDVDGKPSGRMVYAYNPQDDVTGARTLEADGKTLKSRTASTYDEKGRLIVQAFFGADDKPLAQPDGSTRIEVTYAISGAIKAKTFAGYVTPRSYAKNRVTLDDRGREVEDAYFDDKGNPVAGPDGYAVMTKAFNNSGKPVSVAYVGEAGQPVFGPEGFAIMSVKYNDAGQEVEKSYVSKLLTQGHRDGYQKLTNVYKDGIRSEAFFSGYGDEFEYDVLHRRYDARGNIVEESTTDDAGVLVDVERSGYARVTYRYDAAGKVVEQLCHTAAGGFPNEQARTEKDGPPWVSRVISSDEATATVHYYNGTDHIPMYRTVRNKEGKLLSKTWLDAKGEPTIGSDGTAMVTYTYNADGREIERAFWDMNKQPARIKTGIAEGSQRYTTRYGDNGNKAETIYFGRDPALGHTTIVIKYDDRGDSLETRYLNDKGEPAVNPDGVSRYVRVYDEGRRLIEEHSLGIDDKPIAGPLISGFYRRVYDPKGTLEYDEQLGFDGSAGFVARRKMFDEHGRIAEIICLDAKGNPAVNNSGFARKAYEYNGDDQITAIFFYDASDKLIPFELVVNEVTRGGQAERLGIQVGDVLMKYNGHELQTPEQYLYRRIMQGKRNIELVIRRQDRTMTLQAKPGELGASYLERPATRQ